MVSAFSSMDVGGVALLELAEQAATAMVTTARPMAVSKRFICEWAASRTTRRHLEGQPASVEGSARQSDRPSVFRREHA